MLLGFRLVGRPESREQTASSRDAHGGVVQGSGDFLKVFDWDKSFALDSTEHVQYLLNLLGREVQGVVIAINHPP